jgi:hypothetical protein
MAIFSYSIGATVRRSAGHSAVKVAAYQAREKYIDERTGYTYNFRPRARDGQSQPSGIASAAAYIGREDGYEEGRKDALFVGLYAPKDAPEWCRGHENIEQFWSRAEIAERRNDAQIAERIIIALPTELTLEQNIWLLQDHIKEFTRQGRVVQVAIHAPEHGDERNVHAHLLIAMRAVDAQGFSASKADGQLRYLHRRDYVSNLRERWTEAANRHLGRHGHTARIDHRTLAEQGIDRVPTMHLGPGDSRRQRHGQRSVAGEINREVAAENVRRTELVDKTPAIDRAAAHKDAAAQKSPRAPQGRGGEDTASGRAQSDREKAPRDDDYWRTLIDRNRAAHKPAAPTPATEISPAPAVAAGMTRLYRAEATARASTPEWLQQAQEASGHTAAEGRWFVADPMLLAWYTQDIGPDAKPRVAYVDIPTDQAEAYRVSNSTEQIGPRRVRSFSRDPEREFFLPRDIADKRQGLPADSMLVRDVDDVAQLQRDAMLARVPSGWRDLTVHDIGRNLSASYDERLKEIAQLRKDIEKNRHAIEFSQRDMIEHNHERDLRWQQLGWVKKALHTIGLRDRKISEHEAAAKKASRGFDRMRTRRWALGGALQSAERQAERELEKVRPEAETALAERKEKARAARATLGELQAESEHQRKKQALGKKQSQRRGFRSGL